VEAPAVAPVGVAEQPRPAQQADAVQQGGQGGPAAPGHLGAAAGVAQARAEKADLGVGAGEVAQPADGPGGGGGWLLRKKRWRPRAQAAAWLLARAKPALVGLRRSVTWGNSPATMSAAPSVEPLSTTITSTPGPCRRGRRERRQARSRRRQFQLTMHTDT